MLVATLWAVALEVPTGLRHCQGGEEGEVSIAGASRLAVLYFTITIRIVWVRSVGESSERQRCTPQSRSRMGCPMYRSATGTLQLNQLLQRGLNPHGQSWTRGGVEFRVGDKVMQTRNNYDKAVFNGDLGRLRAIDTVNHTVTVEFETAVKYDFGEMDELVLAYAISVHKAQGAEYRAVILPITTQHYLMLQRNLLYTAITRARELVVLVGTQRAIAIAVNNNEIAARHTALADRLRTTPAGL